MNKWFGKKILVIGAHPDDLEINAGGTIHKLSVQGSQVITVTLTDKMASNGIRINEAKAAQKILKVVHSEFFFGSDTRLHENKTELIHELDSFIKVEKPDTIITHFHADTHQDHSTAYEIVMAAARNVPNILLFKPTFPSGRTDIPFHPNYVSRLTSDDMACKMEAINKFKSQKEKYGEDQWIESLKSTAAGDAWTYGGFHGFAEVFQVSRLIF